MNCERVNLIDEVILCEAKNCNYCGKERCFHNVVMILVRTHCGSKVPDNCCAMAADNFAVVGCFLGRRIVGYYAAVDYYEELRIAGNF